MKRSASSSLRPRFLPVLIASAVGLAFIKVVGLATQGGYMSAPDRSGFGRALGEPRRVQEWAQADITGAAPAKKPEAAAAKLNEQPQPIPPAPASAPSSAERDVLEKLGERRKELDDRARELELREQLLKSAEKIAADRIDELKRGEARQTAAGNSGAGAGGDLKALAGMYETMKPRDAARVFDKIDPGRLLPLARQMSPKKLAEVLAAMSPDAAEKLTLLMLAPRPGEAPRPVEPQPGQDELPRLATPSG